MTSKSCSAAFIALLFAAVAIQASAADPPVVEKKPPVAANAKIPAPNRVLVTISKETTVITKPLRKDGYPDYVAALNDLCSKGVTPENNAVVLLWKAIGPGPVQADDRSEYFRLLGMPIPPDKGDYFVDSDAFAKKISRRRQRANRAMRRTLRSSSN